MNVKNIHDTRYQELSLEVNATFYAYKYNVHRNINISAGTSVVFAFSFYVFFMFLLYFVYDFIITKIRKVLLHYVSKKVHPSIFAISFPKCKPIQVFLSAL